MARSNSFKVSPDHRRNGYDPNRQVIERFVLRLVVAGVLIVFVAPEFRVLFFSTFMVIASVVTGVIALVRQERFNGPTLNHWDEALAFLALANLAGAFADPEAIDMAR